MKMSPEARATVARICAMKPGDWTGMTAALASEIANSRLGLLDAPFQGRDVPDALLEALPVIGVNYGRFTAEARPFDDGVIVGRHRPRKYPVRQDLDRKDWPLPKPVRCSACSGSGQMRYWKPLSLSEIDMDITAETTIEMPPSEECRTCNGHGLVGASSDD